MLSIKNDILLYGIPKCSHNVLIKWNVEIGVLFIGIIGVFSLMKISN